MKLKYNPDPYMWTKYRKILTWEQMKIEGLEMFGHDLGRKAVQSLPEHIHPTMELLYMVSGSQAYYLEEEEYTVKGNQIFWAGADSKHGTSTTLHGRYEYYWFRLEERTCKRFLNLDSDTGERLQKRLLQLPSHLIVPERNLKELIAGSFERLSRDDELSRIEGCAMLVQFLCEIVNRCVDNTEISSEIATAVNYIEAHIEEIITLEELAAVSGLSLSRFKVRFRQEIQVTPREYINLKKIDSAKLLLQNTDRTITDIAFGLSFSSSNYFAVLFRQIVGVSPSVYREQSRAKNKIENEQN